MYLDGGKANEKNIKRDSVGKEENTAAGMGTPNRRTEIKRSECSGLVYTKWHKSQNILLPSSQGERISVKPKQN